MFSGDHGCGSVISICETEFQVSSRSIRRSATWSLPGSRLQSADDPAMRLGPIIPADREQKATLGFQDVSGNYHRCACWGTESERMMFAILKFYKGVRDFGTRRAPGTRNSPSAASCRGKTWTQSAALHLAALRSAALPALPHVQPRCCPGKTWLLYARPQP